MIGASIWRRRRETRSCQDFSAAVGPKLSSVPPITILCWTPGMVTKCYSFCLRFVKRIDLPSSLCLEGKLMAHRLGGYCSFLFPQATPSYRYWTLKGLVKLTLRPSWALNLASCIAFGARLLYYVFPRRRGPRKPLKTIANDRYLL